MTGETHNTAMSGPIGIITTIGVSAILGWFLIRVILILFHLIRDYGTTVASPTGQLVTQIFLDTVWKKVLAGNCYRGGVSFAVKDGLIPRIDLYSLFRNI